jgi:poly(A) polymerase
MTDALALVRGALRGQAAWLVGGSVRDRMLGRLGVDLDIVVAADPAEAAQTLARSAGHAACFSLSDDFGAWRVLARDGSWQVDVEGLRGVSVDDDLALRDFTVNAMAQPIQGEELIDPLGGSRDLTARRLRMVSERTFLDDPLRVLRLVRIAVELGFQVEAQTFRSACQQAAELKLVAGERIFMELRRVVDSEQPARGLQMMHELGALAAVLPELAQLRGVEQSRFHHLDVYGHTIEVLEQAVRLQREPGQVAGSEHEQALRALLAAPLADGLSRGGALRWGALLHDVAKPITRAVTPRDGRITFFDHDKRGVELARTMLSRLRVSERLRAHVAALVGNQLRLGFLIHEHQPLARGEVYDYLRACEPVEVDVTLLSIADRLATRGEHSQESIQAHLALARRMLADAFAWRQGDSQPRALWRGDELAGELGIAPGPDLGVLLGALSRAQYAGEIKTPEQALALARSLLAKRA